MVSIPSNSKAHSKHDTIWGVGAEMKRRLSLARAASRALMVSAVSLAFASVSAQAQLRLHSDSEEAVTTALVAQISKAQTEADAALDAQRAYFVEAIDRQRKLRVQYELVRRDDFFVEVMGRPSSTGLLRKRIGEDWHELVGPTNSQQTPNFPQPNEDSIFVQYANAFDELERGQRELSSQRRQLDILVATFEAKGGKGKYCDADGKGDVKFEANGDTDEATTIRDVCGEIKKNSDRIAVWNPKLKSFTIGGLLAKAIADAKDIAGLNKAQAALAKQVAAQVKALDAYYQCELSQATFSDTIKTSAAATQEALNSIASGKADAVFKTSTITGLFKILPSFLNGSGAVDCSKPVEAESPQPPEGNSGISPQDILNAIKAIDHLAVGDALLGALRDAALTAQESALEDALQGLAAAPADKPATLTGQRAQAALRIFGNLDRLYLARSGQLPDTAGVLVALADVKMRQSSARIESNRLAELERLAALRVTALRKWGILLVKAHNAIPKNSNPVGRGGAGIGPALLRYNDSVNFGAIPAKLTEFDMKNDRYLPWIDREKAIVDASYAMLALAAAQLQAYGKGGLRPETIAQILHAIGVGAIAVK